MKCVNFNKIQPIAPDKRAHPKASSLLVIYSVQFNTEVPFTKKKRSLTVIRTQNIHIRSAGIRGKTANSKNYH